MEVLYRIKVIERTFRSDISVLDMLSYQEQKVGEQKTILHHYCRHYEIADLITWAQIASPALHLSFSFCFSL